MNHLKIALSPSSQSSVPQSNSEALLYSVLERANLTQYFGDFIAQGGDDLQQLCEAGEDEFLEIMALVGMASKPLHIRRLQKALQEWALFPEKFKSSFKGSASVPAGGRKLVQNHLLLRNLIAQPALDSLLNFVPQRTDKSTSPSSETSDLDAVMPQNDLCLYADNKLSDLQIQAIEQTASEHAKQLPLYAPKPLNNKKPVDREIEEAMSLPAEDGNRLELFRKYGAIYGRFDSKRSRHKQLNFHEMCVNEAAAQLCVHRPSLITRREDLFFQARQVVKEAGFQLTRVQYRSKEYPLGQEGSTPPSKMAKLSPSLESEGENPAAERNGHSSYHAPNNLFQTPLSWSKNSSYAGDRFLSPSSLLLSAGDEPDDLARALGDGELSLVEEGLRIARQYGMSALTEENKSIKIERNSL